MPEQRLLAVTTPLDGADPAFILTRVSGREELSRPFVFELELVVDTTTTVAPADLVGKGVGWTIAYPESAPRQFHGCVRRLIAGEFVGRGKRIYRAEIVPWLWFLTRTTDCKIFQTLSAVQIIQSVFSAFSFTDFDISGVKGTYPARDYCVQYRETAFAFVSRLMEEEGIFYFFTYAADKHTLMLADDIGSYADCSPHNKPEYRPEHPDSEAVTAWARRYEFGSGKVTLTDYNFETPSTQLLQSTSTTVDLPNISAFELFDFPGRYPIGSRGLALAKVRIAEVEMRYDTAAGTSRCSSFLPGGKFAMSRHPSDTDPFVLTAVDHSASEPLTGGVRGGRGEYQNTFTCMLADTLFRPARIIPRPIVEGPQTAVVTGVSGEEIYTDKYGRVKVQFFWDRYGKKDEKSSCWLRVGELWAGKNWGMIFTPRIGQEVIVDFLEGDPDQPIITGRVYNAEQMPPYTLPDNMTQSGLKTRSTKGGGTDDFNELRFEDKKGNEDIFFHAQKDFHREVENDDTLFVGHDQAIEIKNNRTLTVDEGYEKITISKGDRERTVSKGNDSLTITQGKRTVTVKMDQALTVQQGDRSATIQQGNDTLTISQGNMTIDVTAGTALMKAGTSITLKVGSNKMVIDTSGVLIDAQNITFKVGSNQIAITSSGIDAKGMTVAVAGDTSTKISGLSTEVDGSGTLTLKGGMVMIN